MFADLILALAVRPAAPVAPNVAPPRALQSARAETPDFATLLPADTLAYVEVREPLALLRSLDEHPLLAAARPAAGWIDGAENGADLREGLAALERIAKRPAESVLDDLSAGGAALGLGLRRLQPAFTAVFEGATAARVDTSLGLLWDLAVEFEPELAAAREPERRGTDAELWRIDELWIGRSGRRTAFSNDERSLLAALGVQPLPLSQQLRANEAFDAAFSALEPAAERAQNAARADGWVALAKLVAAGALTGSDDLRELSAMVRDPGAQGALGPGLAGLGHARSLALAFEPGPRSLQLTLGAESIAAPGTVLRPRSGGSARLDRDAPGQLGHAMLYRDFATLTEARAELLSPTALPMFSAQLAEADVLFGGLRLAEDVLPDIDPWIELTARRIRPDAHTAPGIELPAVALLLRVADLDAQAQVLESALQNLTALSNVDRAQNGLPPMLMRLERDGERTWSTARWADLPAGEVAGLEYNFAPAWARIDDLFVIATHESLLIELFDELTGDSTLPAEGAPAPGPPAERLWASGADLAELASGQLERLALAGALSGDGDAQAMRASLEPLLEFAAATELALELSYPEGGLRGSLRIGTGIDTGTGAGGGIR